MDLNHFRWFFYRSYFIIHKKIEKTSEEKTGKKSEQELMEEYIKTFSKKELQSYEIAKNHLGTSFQLEKSNGFLIWKKQQEA
jgi:hypothetical protein